MHRRLFVFAALLFGLLAAPAVSIAPASAADMRDLAPADRYFGVAQMSVLGIRNTLDDVERAVLANPLLLPKHAPQLALVGDAIRDWRSQYPHDPWLSRSSMLLARIGAITLRQAPAVQRATVADRVGSVLPYLGVLRGFGR